MKILLSLISFILTFSLIVGIFLIDNSSLSEELDQAKMKSFTKYSHEIDPNNRFNSYYIINLGGCEPCIASNVAFVEELHLKKLLKETLIISIGRISIPDFFLNVPNLKIDTSKLANKYGIYAEIPKFYARKAENLYNVYHLDDVDFTDQAIEIRQILEYQN